MSIFNSDLSFGKISPILKDVKASIRFIGILGSGMYPLACLMRGRGCRVSGSDRNAGEDITDSVGIRIERPGDGNFGMADLAVYSLAIDESDPEILYARSRGIPLISRAQLLGALMSECKIRISVSGSHGKSTVTALIEHILSVSGKAPTAVSGAALSSGEAYARGDGGIFLAEACEYKDSFLRLCPTHQLITSVELDHTDYFADLDALRASFLSAARLADTVIINRDDRVAGSIADELRASFKSGVSPERVVTYGKAECADYRLHSIERAGDITRFSVTYADNTVRLSTSLMGEFNLYNITAAAAAALSLGVSDGDVAGAVGSFRTINRRLSRLARIKDSTVFYDYAHHPTEIAAVIDALKERYGSVTVIFRPHTFSRTKSLWADFITALCKADFTILLDIYPAREKAIDGVDSQSLAAAIPGAVCLPACDAALRAVLSGSGAIALLGAGEVEGVRDDLVRLGEKTRDL